MNTKHWFKNNSQTFQCEKNTRRFLISVWLSYVMLCVVLRTVSKHYSGRAGQAPLLGSTGQPTLLGVGEI